MKTLCENCVNFMYDDENDCSFCSAALDEDDMMRFLTRQTDACPFFRFYDEYSIVRKQN